MRSGCACVMMAWYLCIGADVHVYLFLSLHNDPSLIWGRSPGVPENSVVGGDLTRPCRLCIWRSVRGRRGDGTAVAHEWRRKTRTRSEEERVRWSGVVIVLEVEGLWAQQSVMIAPNGHRWLSDGLMSVRIENYVHR